MSIERRLLGIEDIRKQEIKRPCSGDELLSLSEHKDRLPKLPYLAIKSLWSFYPFSVNLIDLAQKALLLDDEGLRDIESYRKSIYYARKKTPKDFPASIYTINRYGRYLLNSRLDDGEVFIPFERWWWIEEFLSSEVYSLAMQCNALEVEGYSLKSRFKPMELRAVNLLMANYGDMVRNERIKEELWGDNADTYDPRHLMVTRFRMNKVLAELGTKWRIKNIYNSGSELVLSESDC